MYKALKTRKFIILTMLTITVISAICSGCSGQKAKTVSLSPDEPVINESYDENIAMLTVKGEQIRPNDERLSAFPDLGFGFLCPASWIEHPESLTFATVEQGLCVGFLPPSVSLNLEDMSEEAIKNYDFEAYYTMQQSYIKIFFDSSDKAGAIVNDAKSTYQAVEKIATCGDRTYYLAYNTKLSFAGLKPTDADKAAYQALVSSIDEIKNSMVIFPVIAFSADDEIEAKYIQELNAHDMSGNAVTAQVFSSFDLTMINIWATWCGPCVDEMPDLANLYSEMPDNVNLITICEDADTETETVSQILDKCNAGFTTLCGNNDIRTGLLKNVISYPSTIFVDKNGTIVGEPIFGALSSSEYMREIEFRLKSVK